MSDKKEQAKKFRVCFNCLFPGHSVNACRSKGGCSFKHHSLIQGHSQLSSNLNIVNEIPIATQVNNQTLNYVESSQPNSFISNSIISTVSSSRKIVTTRTAVNFCVCPHNQEKFSSKIPALVIEKVTNMIPAKQVFSGNWPHISGLNLADPEFHTSANIDLILGVDACRQLFADKNILGTVGTAGAHFTLLRWVLMGSVFNKLSSNFSNVIVNTFAAS